MAVKKYTINNQAFDQAQLIQHCKNRLDACQDWEKPNYRFILEWLDPKAEFEVTTSGSTDAPKKMIVSRNQMISSAAMTVEYFQLKPGDKVLHCLPSQFISGKMMMVRGLEFGLNIYLTQPKSNPLEGLNEAFDFAAMTPMQAAHVLQNHKTEFCKIKKIILGGAPVSQQLEKQIMECDNEVFVTYGMTETLSHIAIRNLNGKRAGVSYHALTGVTFKTDKRQCLSIDAPHLGIHNLQTNDIVLLTSPVSFQFLGRADFAINSGGIKIHPEKIEHQLAHILRKPFFIHSENDEILGQKIVLYIESPPMDESELLRLRSTMKLYLQSYEMPKNIYFIPRFEYTATDKIIRKNYNIA